MMDQQATGGLESWVDALARDGFVIIRRAIHAAHVETLRRLCASVGQSDAASRRRNTLFGIRHLLTNCSELRTMMTEPPYVELAQSVLGPDARPVYGVFFDKTSGANWPVPWHQDVAIHAGGAKHVTGYEPRPGKDGVSHLLPPVEVSEQMLAMRIHLDDTSATHGALRVIPGSHRHGRLSNEALQTLVQTTAAINCEAREGDVMLMRPLLLHASSACDSPTHRRVVHVEYSAFQLPEGLEWHG